jgi:hypothetical protein
LENVADLERLDVKVDRLHGNAIDDGRIWRLCVLIREEERIGLGVDI